MKKILLLTSLFVSLSLLGFSQNNNPGTKSRFNIFRDNENSAGTKGEAKVSKHKGQKVTFKSNRKVRNHTGGKWHVGDIYRGGRRSIVRNNYRRDRTYTRRNNRHY